MKAWWTTLGGRARAVLAAATALVLALLVAGAWWATHAEQAALFTDLHPQDAAVIAAELDRLKVPYALDDSGTTVLVDASQVHALRLKLMQKDLPLHGAVGLELFNNADIGMTEFAQKVNYQRALQGELTRTILSFPEIRDVRVHLALPEQSLFRQATLRPKAAITVGLRPGRSLRAEQVRGIQRLVASAVPGLLAQEVTIVDQQGVALMRGSLGEDDADASDARLQMKRETEDYLSRKAGLVLEGAFGPGQAIASVDVTLDMDRVRVTTEDVLAAPDTRAGAATGVLVRERESSRDGGAPLEARSADGRAAQGSSVQRDADYQAGRRVEQLVGQPGAIRRLQVVALVRQPLGPEQRDEVQRLVAAAVGAVTERGDRVVVQPVTAVPATVVASEPAPAHPRARPAAADAPAWFPAAMRLGAAMLVVAVAGVLLRNALRRRARPLRSLAAREREREREIALQQVQAWLLQAAPPTGAADVRTGAGARS